MQIELCNRLEASTNLSLFDRIGPLCVHCESLFNNNANIVVCSIEYVKVKNSYRIPPSIIPQTESLLPISLLGRIRAERSQHRIRLHDLQRKGNYWIILQRKSHHSTGITHSNGRPRFHNNFSSEVFNLHLLSRPLQTDRSLSSRDKRTSKANKIWLIVKLKLESAVLCRFFYVD